jgi:hypothetical protein
MEMVLVRQKAEMLNRWNSGTDGTVRMGENRHVKEPAWGRFFYVVLPIYPSAPLGFFY